MSPAFGGDGPSGGRHGCNAGGSRRATRRTTDCGNPLCGPARTRFALPAAASAVRSSRGWIINGLAAVRQDMICFELSPTPAIAQDPRGFIGGTPPLPTGTNWPSCRLCGDDLVHFLDVVLPDQS